MFCKICGAQLTGTPFCTNCGTKVEQPSSASVADMDATVMASDTASAFAAAQAEQPVYQQPAQPAYQEPVYQQPAQTPYQQPAQPAYYDQYGYGAPMYQPEPPKKKNKGAVIGAVIASVIAIIAIILVILFATGVIGGNDEKDKDDDEPKTTSSAIAVEQESSTEAEIITEAPTVPQVTVPVTTYEVGRSYTYLPTNLIKHGNTRFIGTGVFDEENLYIEIDYGNDIYSNGGVIHFLYSEDPAPVNIVIEDGYFWVYTMSSDGQVIDMTEEFESDTIESIIAVAQFIGFDIDGGFEEVTGSMPSSYTYTGTATHPALGTVDVFTCSVEGSNYIIWIDQDTGATARLYENGTIYLDFTSILASSSLMITDYSAY